MRIFYFCSPLRAAEHLQPRPLRASPTAKTASDHEAIVNYYKQQAAGSRPKVDQHKKMAGQPHLYYQGASAIRAPRGRG